MRTEFEQVVRDLRNPMIDVRESEAALVAFITAAREQALLEYALANQENRTGAMLTPQDVAADIREWVSCDLHDFKVDDTTTPE